MNNSTDEEMTMDEKLHVVDSFEEAGGPCCVPSIKMLQRFLFNNIIGIECFEYNNGFLYVRNFGIIDGVTYTIQNGEFTVSADDTTRISSISMNSNKELEMVI